MTMNMGNRRTTDGRQRVNLELDLSIKGKIRCDRKNPQRRSIKLESLARRNLGADYYFG